MTPRSLTPAPDLLLESHENRIQQLEKDVGAIEEKVLPTLARMETVISTTFERWEERLDKIDSEHLISQTRSADIEHLKGLEAARVKNRNKWKARVWGIVSALITAAIAAYLGLSAR